MEYVSTALVFFLFGFGLAGYLLRNGRDVFGILRDIFKRPK